MKPFDFDKFTVFYIYLENGEKMTLAKEKKRLFPRHYITDTDGNFRRVSWLTYMLYYLLGV